MEYLIYIVAEKIKIIFLYGKSRQNIEEAVNMYALRYPKRKCPSRRTIFKKVVYKRKHTYVEEYLQVEIIKIVY